jgi:hypothetical protein
LPEGRGGLSRLDWCWNSASRWLDKRRSLALLFARDGAVRHPEPDHPFDAPAHLVSRAAPAGHPDQSLHDIRLVIGTPDRRHRIVSVADGKEDSQHATSTKRRCGVLAGCCGQQAMDGLRR